jgi:hypothetical protein
MKSLPTQNVFTKGLLLAAAVFSVAATGVIASTAIFGQQYPSLAFAQEELGVTDTTTATDNATGTTTAGGDTTNATTTGGGGNKLAGIIASLQLAPDRLAPEWVTAGYWELESDMPLFGGTNETEPTVNSFDAVVEMTRIADGTFLHTHMISDFRESDILFAEGNTTTINGTATVVTEEGPTENVPVFITLQNNLISIAIDPVLTENHFGPTPITGIILAPEHLQQISNLLTPTAEEAGAGTETTTGQRQGDSAAMTTDTIGNTTEQ